MGVNCTSRGGFSPRLKTLSLSLSLALSGGAMAVGLLGTESAFAAPNGHKEHHAVQMPAWVPKATKLKYHRVASTRHVDAQQFSARMQSFASRTPHFAAAKGGSVIQVTQLSESGEGSLRDALSRAHDGDVVDLSRLSGHVTLTHALSPSSSVVIRGPGRDKLVLDGGGLDRIINSSHDLKISGVTIANGSVTGTTATGGCLNVSGYVYLADTTISNCQAGNTETQYSYGGAVYVNGSLYMYNTQLTQNSTTAYQIAAGGGAFVRTGAGPYSVISTGSTISGNTVALDSSVHEPASGYSGAFGGGLASVYAGSTAATVNVLKYSTISNNSVSAPASALYARSGGGGGASLYGYENAYVLGSTIASNTASVTGYGYGGGLSAINSALIVGSHVTGNTLSSAYFKTYGGGSYVYGSALLGASVVSGNTVTSACYSCFVQGGGVSTKGLSTKYAEVSGNTASATYAYGIALGGGIYSGAQANISESTISGNTASSYYAQYSHGGGAYTIAAAEFDNSTIAFNKAGTGAGVLLGDYNATSPLFTLQSSIVANNEASFAPTSNDIDAPEAVTVAGSNNLVMVTETTVTLPGDTLTDDPKLLPLANNGGPTSTHALDPTSPAIDAGLNPNDDAFDQRGPGYPREVGAPDIGAFELDLDRIFYNGFEFL